jgi:uncharacterized protein YndB with AHSA1/START domain
VVSDAAAGAFSYEVTAWSPAPPEQVFAVVADGAGWSRWAGPLVVRSWWEREGTPPPGGVGAIRALGLPRLGSREEIVVYDPPHRLGYVVLSGLPVRSYRADVVLRQEAGGTRIVWSGSFTPLVAATGPVLTAFVRRTVGSFTRRLAAESARS